jgi:hypothetical protein
MTREFDAPWKEALESYLHAILRILYPSLHAAIDWTVPYESLDAELQQIVRDGEFGPIRADKLFRVQALGGHAIYLLIHIEVQAYFDADFPERMFRYSCRLRERYNQDVESLAILVDDNVNWRPSEYVRQTIVTETKFRFASVKLIDWLDQTELLENDESPVGLVILASLQSLSTNKDTTRRRESKFRLSRLLFLRGLVPEEIRRIFRLIDWLLELPEGIDRVFHLEIYQLSQELKMPLIGSYEQMLRDDMRDEIMSETLLWTLEFRFGRDGLQYAEELQQLPIKQWVKKLQVLVRTATSLHELKEAMKR